MNGYEAFDTKVVEVRLQGHDAALDRPRNYAPTEKFRMNHENECPYEDYDQIGLNLSFIHVHFLLPPWQRPSCGPRVIDTVAEKERRNRGTTDTNSRNHGYASRGCVTVASVNAESRAVTLPTFFPQGFLEV
jgi:hypothetical protein